VKDFTKMIDKYVSNSGLRKRVGETLTIYW
jgi:hypothetical protein